jgi:hypothetical protein
MKTGKNARTLLGTLGVESSEVTVYEPGESCSAVISVRSPGSYVAIIKPRAEPRSLTAREAAIANLSPRSRTVTLQRTGRALRAKSRPAAWSRSEIAIVLDAYVRGDTSLANAKRLANKIGRAVGAVTWKFSNLRRCDESSSAKGAACGSKVDEAVYVTYTDNRRAFNKELRAAQAQYGITA